MVLVVDQSGNQIRSSQLLGVANRVLVETEVVDLGRELSKSRWSYAW